MSALGLLLMVVLFAPDKPKLPSEWECGGCWYVNNQIGLERAFSPKPHTIKEHRWASEVERSYGVPPESILHSQPYTLFLMQPNPDKNSIARWTIAEQYEWDICLEHGETRIRRIK